MTTAEADTGTAPRAPSHRWAAAKAALRAYWPFYLMVAPVIIYFALFLFWPALNGLLISFQKWGLMGSQGWVGLDN